MVYSKPFRTIKNRVRKGKMGVKNLLFSSKKQVFGLQNYELATKLERQNGAKCRFYSEIQTKHKV